MSSGVSEEVVNGSAKFKSRERVPALSYYHQETQVMDMVHIGWFVYVYLLFLFLFIYLFICLFVYLCICLFVMLSVCYEFVYMQAALCRCSQLLRGMVKRSSDDETYLETIARVNPNKGYMYVVDTRPRVRVKNLCCNKRHSLFCSICLSVCLPAWLFVYLLFHYHRLSLIQTIWDRRVSSLVIF